MRKKSVKCVISGICLGLLAGGSVLAAGRLKAAGVCTNEGDISLYVKGFTSEVTSAECQIGTKAGQQVVFENAADMENAPKTLIMVDNSLSITEENREKANAFLMEYVDDLDGREQVALAAFDEGLKEIISYTADRKELEEAIESITYQDQETYLTDVLYDALMEEHLGAEDCYKKVIIISDGVDNKSIGYTKDELYVLIKEKSYPIYTVGCVYKDNNEQLENMFAISRMTGAKEFLLDDTDDTDEIVDAINEDSRAVHFSIVPDAGEMDGSSKNVLLTVQTAAGEEKIEAEVKMPIQAQAEPTAEPEPEKEPEPVPEPEPAEPEKSSFPVVFWLAGAALVLAAAVIFILLRKKKGTLPQEEFEVLKETVNTAPLVEDEQTVLMANQDEGDKTQMIWAGTSKQYTLCLTDVKNPSRIFQQPINNGAVIIGRRAGEADLAIDYEKSVSGRHCQISVRDGKFYVKDLGSSNGTLLNGSSILAEMEIYSGCTLTLGRLELKVEIR